jgi:hypothetical protein
MDPESLLNDQGSMLRIYKYFCRKIEEKELAFVTQDAAFVPIIFKKTAIFFLSKIGKIRRKK